MIWLLCVIYIVRCGHILPGSMRSLTAYTEIHQWPFILQFRFGSATERTEDVYYAATYITYNICYIVFRFIVLCTLFYRANGNLKGYSQRYTQKYGQLMTASPGEDRTARVHQCLYGKPYVQPTRWTHLIAVTAVTIHVRSQIWWL